VIEFKDLLEYCQAEAIANKFAPTEASVWRTICRTYSEKFHTPLIQVLEMDPEHVILNVYEAQSEDLDISDYQKLEHIMDTLQTINDPEYERVKAGEQAEFDRRAEEEEAERVKAGRPVYQGKKKNTFKKTTEPEQKRPTGGMINLDYMSRQDSEE
jgi:hypothetical protein